MTAADVTAYERQARVVAEEVRTVMRESRVLKRRLRECLKWVGEGEGMYRDREAGSGRWGLRFCARDKKNGDKADSAGGEKCPC